MVEIRTDENTSGALDQDRTDDISCVSSSRAAWRNHSGPSPIKQPLTIMIQSLGIRCSSLIKDETPNLTVTPKFSINLDVLQRYKSFLGSSSNHSV